MALLALARLQHPGLATSIAVMGDSLESRGERGAPAIYLAAADVLASRGLAHPKWRRALLKVAPELAHVPDPFSTTIAELVWTGGAAGRRAESRRSPRATASFRYRRLFFLSLSVATMGGVTCFRLPFWHYTTPMVARRARERDARR